MQFSNSSNFFRFLPKSVNATSTRIASNNSGKNFALKCQNLDLDRRWLCSFRRNSHQCCFLWCEVTGMGLFSSKFDDDSIWVRRNAPYLSCPNWEKNCIFHSLTDLKVFPVSCYYHFWSFHEIKAAELKKWWIYVNRRGIQYSRLFFGLQTY